jgi:hypothetical protein
VLRAGFWPGQIVLVHAPYDVADGMRAVDALAAEHRLRSRFSLFESPLHGPDPTRIFRSGDPKVGGHDVILWQAGADPTATLRALRTATGLDVAGTSELLARAPIEILRDVSAADAERARTLLETAGAEVEIVPPEAKRSHDS